MAHKDPHVAHKDPHVDHSPDPRVDLCEPCVDLCEPRGDSGTDDPRVARSDPCVAQVFLQCTYLYLTLKRNNYMYLLINYEYSFVAVLLI